MSTAIKATLVGSVISLVSFLAPGIGNCAEGASKIVTRVDRATAVVKGGRLTVHAEGVAHSGVGGRLVIHKSRQLNKDGLLEYDLCFSASKDSGSKLKPVKATLKESSTFVGLKGVRVYAEYNEVNALISESKKKERAPKKGESILEKKEPEPRKEEPLAKKEQPALKKQETVVTKEKPAPKKEEQATKKEEAAPKKEETKTETKKKSRWRVLNPLNWNPFHRKQVEPEQ